MIFISNPGASLFGNSVVKVGTIVVATENYVSFDNDKYCIEGEHGYRHGKA